ncbi:MAG: integration host factor subunit alpha [Parvularculales bacterium]
MVAGEKGEKSGTLTRADLSDYVHLELGLSRSESSALVNALFDEIVKGLKESGRVKLSSFGTFILRDKKKRMGRNPKTGEAVPIEPRRVLVFRPSQTMKSQINEQSPRHRT